MYVTVTVFAAAHCRRQKTMGSYHSRCVFETTTMTPGRYWSLVSYLVYMFAFPALLPEGVASALVFNGMLETVGTLSLIDAIVNRTADVYQLNRNDVIVKHDIQQCHTETGFVETLNSSRYHRHLISILVYVNCCSPTWGWGLRLRVVMACDWCYGNWRLC